MKPLKLKMTAFGPYKDTEVIDFAELKEHHLFVISGNTGAGKTTIFDGLCFALYGSASGTDRESTSMLRSDFADDQIHTSVELEFELNDKVYRILRQLPHVKKGNKSKTGERYEFFEKTSNGKEIPCVDRQIVSEIDKKVESLIGLTQDQFKQIVMLPQGEFRKLLTSETENKEDILRRIFKTEKYQKLNQLLKEKQQNIKKAFDAAQQSKEQYIQLIASGLPHRDNSALFEILGAEYRNMNQILSGLDEEMAYYKAKIETDGAVSAKLSNAYEQKQRVFFEAESLNKRFRELDEKQHKHALLEERIPEFEQKAQLLAQAEKASRLEPYEQQVEKARNAERQKRAEFQSAEQNFKEAAAKLKTAQASYQREEGREAEREQASREVERLREQLPVIKELESRKRSILNMESELNGIGTELERVISSFEEKEKINEALYQQAAELEETLYKQPEKERQLAEMGSIKKLFEQYLAAKKELAAIEPELRLKEGALAVGKASYQKLEDAWLNSQASVLAQHLHDGSPCPVCGSTSHPQKAAAETHSATKEELDRNKKELEELEKQYHLLVSRFASEKAKLEEKEADLGEAGVPLSENPHEQYRGFVEKGRELQEEVVFLRKQAGRLKELKQQYAHASSERKRLEQEKNTLEQTYHTKKSAYDKEAALFEERLKPIPEQLQSLEQLETAAAEAERTCETLEKAWKQAQQKWQEAKESAARCETHLEHAGKSLEEAVQQRMAAEEQFNHELQEAGFDSFNQYEAAKLDERDRRSLEERIRLFHQEREVLFEQISSLKQSLAGKERADLQTLGAELQQLKQEQDQALRVLNQSQEYLQRVTDLKTHIMETHERIMQLDKQLAAVTDLHDTIRGQNAKKISYERYLQIEYLEQIIEAANERLRRMSNGQFYLLRSDRQESRGKQSGLALDVYDAYTGQTRDVKTLSGGEKFNASLCLALGMSDVIQSFQGNISIKTMFIDEGFGSLDEESLHKSIDTLIDLQKTGRMIGVISHVQELKSVFPAILEVEKTKEGYSRTKFVLK